MKTSAKALVAAIGLAAVAGAAGAYLVWSKNRFDMVAALSQFVASEGPWDNEWDKPQEKIAGVLALIKGERDPQKRFELRRELAQRYVIAGANEAAIATLDDMRREVGKT